MGNTPEQKASAHINRDPFHCRACGPTKACFVHDRSKATERTVYANNEEPTVVDMYCAFFNKFHPGWVINTLTKLDST